MFQSPCEIIQKCLVYEILLNSLNCFTIFQDLLIFLAHKELFQNFPDYY